MTDPGISDERKLCPITIVGGGLAGLTLGIALRREGIPVTIWEAGAYPRHRVCGEFISGKGQEILAELGLLPHLLNSGAQLASTVAFFTHGGTTRVKKLPRPAFCLSRFRLDACLAEQFQEAGGELLVRSRWQGPFTAGVVRASGRRPQSTVHGSRWFGLKAHARGIALTADLEMYLVPNGYVGLCRLDHDWVNVCGLFRRSIHDTQNEQATLLERLQGTSDGPLRERLQSATFSADTFCSIAGISLQPQRGGDVDECRIGDALTMIAPITGNGMSMAFESAQLAVGPLTAYSRGRQCWQEAQQDIAMRCDQVFGRRLRWASWAQDILFREESNFVKNSLIAATRWIWPLVFRLTR